MPSKHQKYWREWKKSPSLLLAKTSWGDKKNIVLETHKPKKVE